MNRRRLRRDALRMLDELSLKLIDRFGSGTTLGEMRAAIVTQRAIFDEQPLTVSEIARRSGQPKQSISRWAKRVPWLVQSAKPDDARSKLVDCKDPDRLVAYVDELIAIMAPLIEQHARDLPDLNAQLAANGKRGPSRTG